MIKNQSEFSEKDFKFYLRKVIIKNIKKFALFDSILFFFCFLASTIANQGRQILEGLLICFILFLIALIPWTLNALIVKHNHKKGFKKNPNPVLIDFEFYKGCFNVLVKNKKYTWEYLSLNRIYDFDNYLILTVPKYYFIIDKSKFENAEDYLKLINHLNELYPKFCHVKVQKR